MHPTYAFSLSGERYSGNYPTRDEALTAAIEAARRAENQPQTVFVGRRVAADPKASGHARAVLSNMAARAREQFGDAASSYLNQLSKTQIENLDKSLELVICGWLEHNELIPTFSRVESIGEYRVPDASSQARTEDYHEVQEIGVVGD
jgi:hypothetical protein